MAAIFGSHSSRDDALASHLEAWLQAAGVTDLFIDHGHIPGTTVRCSSARPTATDEARPPSVGWAGRRHIEPQQQYRAPCGQHAPGWARAASSPRTDGSARTASRKMDDKWAQIEIGAVNTPPPSCRACGPGRRRAFLRKIRSLTKLQLARVD